MSPFVSTRLLLTQSDERLVKLAREGHERAFEALVHRYRRPLLTYCRRLLLPDERAEDALQQGLLQAWLALQDGADVHDARPWLYRVVHNAALNMLRVSGYDYAKLSETLQGAGAPEDDLDRRIAVRDAFAGLAALPAMQREALLRTAVDGHSHEHVAQAMGLSEGALRGLVYRARATLRAATTALTPQPALSWALSHRGVVSSPLTARLAELGAGGGSVGVGGLLLKGSAVVVTAGALAGGVAITHPHPVKVPPSWAAAPADAASSPRSAPSASTAADGSAVAQNRKDALGPNDRHHTHGHPGRGEPQRSSVRADGHPFPGLHDGSTESSNGRAGDHNGNGGPDQSSGSKSGSGDHERISSSSSKDGSGGGSSSKDGTSSGEGSRDGKDLSVSGSGSSDFGSNDGTGSTDGSEGSTDGTSSGSGGEGTSSPEAGSGSGDGSKSGDSQLEAPLDGSLLQSSAGKDGSSTGTQAGG